MRHRVNKYRSFFFYLSALIYIASFVLAGASPNLLLLFFAFLLGCLFLYPCLGLKKSALDSPAFLYLCNGVSSHVAWYDVLICSHLASIECSSWSANVWNLFCRAMENSWRWSGDENLEVSKRFIRCCTVTVTFRLAIPYSWPASAHLENLTSSIVRRHLLDIVM